MGDSHDTEFAPSFNGSLRVEGRLEKLTANAGLVLLREVDDRLGISDGLSEALVDHRSPERIVHPQRQMIRALVQGMAVDSMHTSAAAAMGDDHLFRMTTSDKKGLSMIGDEQAVASQPTLSRFMATLGSEVNLPRLRSGIFESAVKAVHGANGGRLDEATLDIDSYPIRVHGSQAGSEFNGHYDMRCYHPLGVMLGETGHWLDLALRPGAVHTANGAKEMLSPLIDQARECLSSNVRVRGDAGFIQPGILEMLDKKSVPYALRLPTNKILKGYEEIHARRGPGRRPDYEQVFCHEIEYRAATWKRPRRVVLVVVDAPGELFLNSFFIVTSFNEEELCGRDVLDFYRTRGTMEGHIGEMKSVIEGRLSSTNRQKSRYAEHEVRHHAEPIDPERVNAAALCVHAIAYNLLSTFRSLAGESDFIDEAPELGLKRARRLLRIPGRIVISSRRATLVIKDTALALWRKVTGRIRELHPLPATR